jgi:nucleoside-diphosphate-sugar epimerase
MTSATSLNTDWPSLHGEFFNGSRVLITGGAGFIGSHLVAALASLGASVVVLDDLSGGSVENIRPFKIAQFVEGSIVDADLVRRSARGCRFVFHLAALGSVPASVEKPLLYQDVNANGTLNVLAAARDAKSQRVIFSASSSAYGDNDVPWVEHMPIRPKSPYAATKVAGEALLRAFSCSYGLDTVSLRYFNIFGPRQNANSAYAAVIAAFAKAVLAGQAPIIHGDGKQSRDFTYVDNAVHANLLAARRDQKLAGEVINVGCGTRIDVLELAARVGKVLGRADLIPTHAPERVGDIKHSFADLTLARSLLGYEPLVSFADGLTPTLAWYKQTLG